MVTNGPAQAACSRVLRSILAGMILLVLTFSFSAHLLAFAHSSASPAKGKFIEYPLPDAGSPFGITNGPDGNLWFTEYVGNKIGKITTKGKVTEYPLQGGEPYGITAGPGGSLWFTENGANKIGKITTKGKITEYTIPTNGSAPRGITADSNGDLWFAENGANKIGEFIP